MLRIILNKHILRMKLYALEIKFNEFQMNVAGWEETEELKLKLKDFQVKVETLIYDVEKIYLKLMRVNGLQ